jgi:hypothetical protein
MSYSDREHYADRPRHVSSMLEAWLLELGAPGWVLDELRDQERARVDISTRAAARLDRAA